MSSNTIDLLNTTPFFYRIHGEDKEIKSIRYVYESNAYMFQARKSKTVQSGTLEKIWASLNHLLLWAKTHKVEGDSEADFKRADEEWEFKKQFIYSFTLFIHDMHKELTDVNFMDMCINKLNMEKLNAYGKKPELKDIYSKILTEWVERLLDNAVLMRGIIKYAHEYTNLNSLEKVTKNKHRIEVSLNRYDLFAIIVFVIIAKIIHLAFSVYSTSTKAEEIVVRPVMKVIENLKYKIIDFYHNEYPGEILMIQEMMQNNYEENIISYIESTVSKLLEKEKNRPVFENVGFTEIRAKNFIRNITLTSLFKILPVYDKDENSADTLIPFIGAADTDWRDYRYVSNCVIMYMNKTIRDALKNNSKVSTSNISRTIVDDSTDNNTMYKQEVYLESRNTSVLERKKKIISLLHRWCEDKRLSIGEFEQNLNIDELQIGPTPLRHYMLTTLMNELSEDIVAQKLLDKNTIANLVIVLSHRLKELGYIKLSTALISRGVSSEGSVSLHEEKENIKRLKKYKISPEKTEAYISDIASRHYYPNDLTIAQVDISSEFVKFLKDRESKKFKLIDAHIYQYAK